MHAIMHDKYDRNYTYAIMIYVRVIIYDQSKLRTYAIDHDIIELNLIQFGCIRMATIFTELHGGKFDIDHVNYK